MSTSSCSLTAPGQPPNRLNVGSTGTARSPALIFDTPPVNRSDNTFGCAVVTPAWIPPPLSSSSPPPPSPPPSATFVPVPVVVLPVPAPVPVVPVPVHVVPVPVPVEPVVCVPVTPVGFV